MKIVIEMEPQMWALVREGQIPVRAYECIVKGTPLPKGHGRLIDADELKKHKYHDNNRFEDAVAIAQVDWADTIIDAESEE